ncbi:hypothetical protein CJ739_1726 [Mariniflexile rhizosphaerae]|uniref:hypothetical protein n=1 Tax=unclassified Mariniflexile TaxID=2643887 RepID=UPI000CB064F8|nr:hypothetical protein [Mariniflexile sp. TRM1-10]AXP80812.1 hypothetical protein CJ739_1726 [Mariniflexile sp. TRM1-10]PLB17652.1 MAG: putative bacterial general secretion pathway protein [Flavobacteriaceae bacterium FS1-H7996/R]
MTKKNKNIVLVAGFILALFLCYHMAVSKTLVLKKEHDHLKSEAILFENTPKQVSLLKQKQLYYDGLLSKYQLNGSSVQNSLLRTINAFADSTGLKVVGFLEPHTVLQNDLKVSTYQFTLEGDFNAILRLIHKLERDTGFGEIINLHFEKKTNFRTGKAYLQAQVLLKSFG